MNGLPAEMIDRWQSRAEPAPGEGLIYWHVLVGHDPAVLALAAEARRRLARFPSLHMTPPAWLHMTVLIAGAAHQVSADQIEEMAAMASRQLANIPPVTMTLGKILYHPEAIMLAARPADVLLPVLKAAQEATRKVTGSDGWSGGKLPWTPHVTLAYSTAQQPAQPIISALGGSLPERQVQLREVSLVNQRGPERDWDWNVEATIRFGET